MFRFDPVAQHDFLRRLTASAYSEINELARTQRFRKGELIFQAGSQAQNVYILKQGRVKIFQMSDVGKEVIQWFCFPGELFGLAEAAQYEYRTVYAQAGADSELISISQEDFRQHLNNNPDTANLVISLLSNRLRTLGTRLLNVTSDDVRSRVIKLLQRLAYSYGTHDGHETCLDLRLTHQELADMIGASRQTVTTILGSLRREGWLRVNKSRMYIPLGPASDPVLKTATVSATSPGPASNSERRLN